MSQFAATPTKSPSVNDDAATVPSRLLSKSHSMGGGLRCLLTFTACTVSLGLVVASLRWRMVEVGDKISYPHGAFVLAMGFVFFIALTHFLHTLLLHTQLGREFCLSYRLLASDALEITNK